MTTLAGELVGLGFDPLLVSTHGPVESQLIAEARAEGVPVENLRMGRLYDPAGPVRFLRILRRQRPAIVHTRTTRADLLGRMGARVGAATVTNIVNMYPQDCLAQHGPVLGRAVMAAALLTKRATTLFAVNAAALAANVREAFGVSASDIRLVYDGIDLSRWNGVEPANIPGVSDSDIVCLTVARLHPQKGLTDLVEAALQVAANPAVKFVVAGDGPQRPELAARIKQAGLDQQFVLLGHRDDIPALLARSAVFVLPSRFEGLPSAAIEAMAAGKAIVATSVAGIPELVDEGVNGWLVPPASPRSLAETINKAIRSDLKAVGTAARIRAEEQFSAATMAAAFVHVYEEALQTTAL